MNPALSPKTIRGVWLRQFLIQACWNYEGMQNIGFAYCIAPALRELYADRPEELRKALRRHLEFFNTHPGMAAVVLGAGVRLEERIAAGEADARSIGTFKVGLMGSLGAIGDAFFWGALKPMACVAGAILSFVHPLLGIAGLLLLYNATHLGIRWRGFAKGMAGEESAVGFLREAGFTGKTEDRKMVAAILGGGFAGVVASHAILVFGAAFNPAGLLVIAVATVHLFTALFRKSVSPSELLFLLFLIGMMILWR